MKKKLKYYLKLLINRNIKKMLDAYYDYELQEVTEDSIILIKKTKLNYEKVEIQDDSYIRHVICERRCNGVIVTELEQLFATTAYSGNKKTLVHLSENRYVLTDSTLNTLISIEKDLDFEKWLEEWFSYTLDSEKLYQKIGTIPIIAIADMVTAFSTSMCHMVKNENGDWVPSSIIPTRTYLNGEDVSFKYDTLNGNDKLYRVYDLYNGVISKRNEKDIKNIHLGLLTTDAFGLKTLKGITAQEDALVGKSLDLMNREYINYVKKYFFEEFGYDGEIKYDRDSLLKCITYVLSSSEIAKRTIEKMIGVSYEEFELMDSKERDKYLKMSRLGKYKPSKH